MKASRPIPTGIRVIIGFLVLSVCTWVVGQGGAVVAYDRVTELGFHPERHKVAPITVLVTQGIAVGDVLIQIQFFLVATFENPQRNASFDMTSLNPSELLLAAQPDLIQGG